MEASVKLFKALADESRLALVSRLACAAAPVTVTAVSDCCGVHLSGVSRHLAQMREAGIVTARRSGREVLYSLNATAVAAALRDLAQTLEECCPK